MYPECVSKFPGRIVPGFLVQTGDKTGTGGGGESFYGGMSLSWFTLMHGHDTRPKNHSRMKFTRDCGMLTVGLSLWPTMGQKILMIPSSLLPLVRDISMRLGN
jgi:hypothetical protein